MLPHLTQIADLPTYPGIAVVDNLMEVCQRELWESVERGSVAMLLSRPGQAPLTDSDRAWARALVTAADRSIGAFPAGQSCRVSVSSTASG